MARYLSTIPNNLGFYNLGTVWSYPTGGTGPTAYGPTSYYGSDPLPSNDGDSLYNAVDLGDLSTPYRSLTISNTHGGLSRRQSSFYKFKLTKEAAIQFTQNFSQFSYKENTNRNTLIAFYKITEKTLRTELPINNGGYVYKSTGVEYDSGDEDYQDYPNIRLEPGDYVFLITNDIRYQETTYSITISSLVADWRYVWESADLFLDFGLVTEGVTETIDYGSLAA
jgi:CRISPR/Cas system-associated endoribonuclease Cas2